MKEKKRPTGRVASEDGAKEQLLEAASKLFAAKGFGATSIRQIAAAADLNIGLISYYYNGKEGLYRACIEAVRDHNLNTAAGVLASATSAADLRAKLQKLMEAFFDIGVVRPHIVPLIERAIQDEIGVSISADVMADVLVRPLQMLAVFLGEAQDKGYIRLAGSPLEVANMINSLISHALRYDAIKERVTGLTLKDPGYRRHLASVTTSAIVDGMSLPEVAGKPVLAAG